MRKHFNIFMGILCCMFCCLLCSLSVRADMIWTPEDSFYLKHESECSYVNRQYTANGPDGIVILYKSPEMPVEVARWENGFQARISFTYEDGRDIVWGIYENAGTRGWMPMEYMDVVYDTISFEEEFGDQIADQRGALDSAYLGKEIYSWAYPGDEQGYPLTIEKAYGQMPEYSRVFVDENGNRWGRVGYYLGYKNFWICLDQPQAEAAQLYPEGAPLRGKEETDTRNDGQGMAIMGKTGESERIVPKMNNGMVRAAVYMVLLVVLVTGGLLISLRRGKRNP